MLMTSLKRVFVMVIAGLLVALAGCATERSAAGEFFEDTAITTRVKKAIYDEPSLKVTDISVATEDKVVHLTGTVKSRAEAVTAARVARKVEGVKRVKNDLKVKP
jgi:osmotically-inducible protein OsmY